MKEVLFPESATEEEKKSLNLEISSSDDQTLGFKSDGNQPPKTKFAVRNIVLNEKGEIALVKSFKYGYTQIPGGGLEDGETIEEALRRETAEEIGYTVEIVKPLGYFRESRESNLNKHSWTTTISFVYLSKALENVGTNYMEYEIAEGFAPIWANLDEAIKDKEAELQKLLDNKSSYSGTFSSYRDLSILKFYQANPNQSS